VADGDDQLLADLRRDSRKRGLRILAIMGLVIMLVGIGLIALGFSYEEPSDRIATRKVPQGAPIGLMIFGGLVALGGIGLLVKSRRVASGKEP
jgi:uncharacterized membrane protein